MKKLFSLALVAVFSAVLAGCEASGRVGDDDETRYERKTTVRDYDGDTRTTETEIRRDD